MKWENVKGDTGGFRLKSDYFRIEIDRLGFASEKLSGLKSDYFRIEMVDVNEGGIRVAGLKSDYFRIEIL